MKKIRDLLIITLLGIAFLFSHSFAKEPTNIMIGVGFGAGYSKLAIEHLHAVRYANTWNNNNATIKQQSNSNHSSWALSWEFLLGYKHFLNDWIGLRYYANVGIQHYKHTITQSKSQPIELIDYTLNADLLINFYENQLFSIGMASGIGVGGTSIDNGFIKEYMPVYRTTTGDIIGTANVQKHILNANANLGIRLTIFQKVRRVNARVCDSYKNGRRICRVPVFYLGHSIEANAKFPLLDYRATPRPDILRENGEWIVRPEYRISNPYRFTMRYIMDF